jgi:hypothetical protein
MKCCDEIESFTSAVGPCANASLRHGQRPAQDPDLDYLNHPEVVFTLPILFVNQPDRQGFYEKVHQPLVG